MTTGAAEIWGEPKPSPGGVDRPNYVPVGHDLSSVTEKISGLVLTRPTGLGWYLPRTSAAWKAVMWAIVVFHFTIPFFPLLMRPIKRSSTAVAAIAGLILFMHLVFAFYQVVPVLSADSVSRHWMDVLTPVGIGGPWLACFLWQLQRRPLLAPHDYNRAAALHLRRLDEEEAAREETLVYG